MCAFFIQKCFWKLFSTYVLALAQIQTSYKKVSRKMLMKLTQAVNFIIISWSCFSYKNLATKITKRNSVNFINVLRAAFAPVDPKSVKRYWQLDWILTLLGATCLKALRKYVDEIEPKWPSTQRLQAPLIELLTGLHAAIYNFNLIAKLNKFLILKGYCIYI